MLRPDRLRIVVAGMVAGVPHHGGATWAVLQWVLGLRRLGHDVVLVEPVDVLRPPSVSYFRSVAADFGLADRAALVDGGGRAEGVPFSQLAAFARNADVVVNVAGMLRHAELVHPAPARVYLDLDPAFTQLWQADGIDMGFDGHTHFVTVGLNIGAAENTIPTDGRRWLTTLPPVVLTAWPAAGPVTTPAFTTVASWRGYGSVEHDGVRHGQKAHAWRAFVELPRLAPAALLPALGIHPGEHKDVALLEEHGWRWLDPEAVAHDPDAYRSFIQGSLGELAIAKEGYVVSRSGWFSDRSACYLASGRPVVAQDTGWSEHLPADAGLLGFDSADGAAAAMADVLAEPERHRVAARRIAEEHLDSDRVLGAVLEAVLEATR